MPGVLRGISAQVMPMSTVAAQQLVRIEQAEREADDRGDRRERDVALGEVELEPDDFAALRTCRGRRCRCRGIDAASEPARGLVSAKQGISSPRARRGR